MDRLSNLPDALLYHILSLMPVQDVVRTTVLSKRWEDFWISVPNLFIDQHRDISPPPHRHFADFVNRTLIFRGRIKIKSFKIRFFLGSGAANRTDFDLWIRYALKNDVEELLLDFIGDQSFYGPPHFLYTYSSIKILRLSMCNISLARQISWTSLKSLTLCLVRLWGEVIQKVLLGCPILEFLEVSYCEGFNGLSTISTSLKKLMITVDLPSTELDDEPELRISAPNVTSLYLSGLLYRKCLLVDMSSLVHAAVHFKAKLYDVEGFDDHQDMLLEILGSLDHVENLTLGGWCIKVLAIKEKKGLPSPPSKRKRLTLVTPIKQEDLPGILHLLKCSPSLEKLELDMAAASFPGEFLYSSALGRLAGFCNFGGENYLTSQENIIHCFLQHLKIVNIAHFVDKNPVFLLIEFLLKKAKVLETMIIRAKKVASGSSESSLLHAAQKLLAIPRSSPGAVVMLLE